MSSHSNTRRPVPVAWRWPVGVPHSRVEELAGGVQDAEAHGVVVEKLSADLGDDRRAWFRQVFTARGSVRLVVNYSTN